jgi:hypothetical protein
MNIKLPPRQFLKKAMEVYAETEDMFELLSNENNLELRLSAIGFALKQLVAAHGDSIETKVDLAEKSVLISKGGITFYIIEDKTIDNTPELYKQFKYRSHEEVKNESVNSYSANLFYHWGSIMNGIENIGFDSNRKIVRQLRMVI